MSEYDDRHEAALQAAHARLRREQMTVEGLAFAIADGIMAALEWKPEQECYLLGAECEGNCENWQQHQEADRRKHPCGLRWHDHCGHGWR